jgi:hypothetical protein
MPHKSKVGSGKNGSRSKLGNKNELKRFFAHARSIGIDPTYVEFERALKRLVSSRQHSRKTRRRP